MKAEKQIDNPTPCNNHKKNSALKLGNSNVQTMAPGFSDDLQEIDDVHKTAVINMELSRLQMCIVALQEMRLSDMGSVKEKTLEKLLPAIVEKRNALAAYKACPLLASVNAEIFFNMP